MGAASFLVAPAGQRRGWLSFPAPVVDDVGPAHSAAARELLVAYAAALQSLRRCSARRSSQPTSAYRTPPPRARYQPPSREKMCASAFLPRDALPSAALPSAAYTAALPGRPGPSAKRAALPPAAYTASRRAPCRMQLSLLAARAGGLRAASRR